jgi:RimJ/RimL family protein N-acetyltransferase
MKIIRDYDEFLGERRLDFQRGELVVADHENNKAVGFMKLSAGEFLSWPLVSVICVSERFRRKGIGRALVDYAWQSSRSPCVYLTTEGSNHAMRALLAAAGWLEVGHIDRFNVDGDSELIFRIGTWPPA